MRLKLQSLLKRLNRQNDDMVRTCKEMLEILARLAELLTNREPEVTMGDERAWESLDGSVELQTVINDEPLTIIQDPLPFYGQLSDLEFEPLESVGVASTPQESVDFVARLPQDIFPYSSNYEPATGDFLSHHGAHPDGQAASGSSTKLDEQPLVTVVQGVQEKVRCSWSGCSRVVKKENLSRHVNEVHRRRIKVVCNQCGNGFARPYLMRDHNCRAKRRNS
ncbi:hypothetical protein BDR04DRAFT_1155468 [Suillus decipiens]|nr:hypothetical protein BDR04DRAFT_1155468 [Suillus decipiens]